jgi:hypothetical protein
MIRTAGSHPAPSFLFLGWRLHAPVFSHVENESWMRTYRGPSRSAVLQEPGTHATASPSSTLLRPFRCMVTPSAPDFGPP